MTDRGHDLQPGLNCWRIERADRASVIVDAEDYYAAARRAMLAARHQIILCGWDFDARIRLSYDPDDHPEAPQTIGALVTWLIRNRPELNIYILRWDKGAIKTLFRGITLLTLTRWRLSMDRIHLKLDSAHPVGASQHQKIVVIDDGLAFCGGIDMTEHRWDTRAHRDRDPRRRGAWGFAYQPWHDATSALTGPAARALGDLCRERWQRAGGDPIAPPPEHAADDRASDRAAIWPDPLPVDFHDRDVAISRTQPEYGDQPKVLEVEQLSVDLIHRAQRHLYIESQYFASRTIANAIADRLGQPDGPEIVIINPVRAQGSIEPLAMDSARARLMQTLEQGDPYRRLRLYHPVTDRRRPIYVHAKLMIVDDRVIRIGSSNFNNRSLRLDTECDITIDADLPGEAGARHRIAAIRDGLLAEHLGVTAETVAQRFEEAGSLIATIESLRGRGKALIPYERPELGRFKTWLADHEVLDPAGPEEMFEPLDQRPGLVRGLQRRLQTRRRRWYGRR